MSSLLRGDVHTAVTCDGQDRVLENKDIYREDGFIRAIGQGLD